MAKPHHWTKKQEALLGTQSDAQVAKRLGLTVGVVTNRRLERGIKAWRTVQDEESQKRLSEQYQGQLGQVSDSEIARSLKVHSRKVARWRRAQGIAPYEGAGAKVKQWTSESEKLLGTMPDRKLADQLGIPRGTVISRRLALGIPPHARWVKGRAGRTRIDGQKVRALRLQLGLSYNQASDFNITRKGHLAKIESGAVATVMPQTLHWLCEVLCCKPEEIASIESKPEQRLTDK